MNIKSIILIFAVMSLFVIAPLEVDAGVWSKLCENTVSNQLVKASREGDINKVQQLIDQGANVNKVGKGKLTALQWAARENFPEIVTLLIDNGADVNKAEINIKTPLDFALANSCWEIAYMLVGRDANCDWGSALLYAVREGQKDIVKMVLEEHCPDFRRVEDALEAAVRSKNYEIAKVLIAKLESWYS